MTEPQHRPLVSPQDAYTEALMSGSFQPDEDQALAVHLLDELWGSLMERFQLARSGFTAGIKLRRSAPPKGVYMWGGVGRGKTWMMDMFFESIPFRRKMRMHFHHFMKRVHSELAALTGQSDPLNLVAESIYKDAVVICFDEFFVSHVSDAMILGELFSKLFEKGVTLVATSNVDPELLYQDGLHRERFLPCIDALKAHTQVVNIDTGQDYRLRVLKQTKRFVCPLNEASERWVSERFEALTHGHEISNQALIVGERPLETLGVSSDVLWCTFRALCMQPRSASDFIEIADQYATVILSNVPHLNDEMTDPTRRFIYLVDELYDRRVNLLVSSEDEILSLYQGKKLAFEIERTRSRLLEMQSLAYLEAEQH